MPKAKTVRARRNKTPGAYRTGEKDNLDRHWRGFVFDKLAETSNVTAAADFAGVNPARTYKIHREAAEFARQWYARTPPACVRLGPEEGGRLRSTGPDRHAAPPGDRERTDGSAGCTAGGPVMDRRRARERRLGRP